MARYRVEAVSGHHKLASSLEDPSRASLVAKRLRTRFNPCAMFRMVVVRIVSVQGRRRNVVREWFGDCQTGKAEWLR